MRKLRAASVLIAILWCGIVGGLLAQAAPQAQPKPADEPLYQGKPLGFWLELLKKGDPLDVEEAIAVLGEIGPNASAALPALTQALTAENQAVRFQAAIAVWKIARDGKAAVPALAEVLKDSSSGSRLLAMQTVAQIGPEAIQTAPQLMLALADNNPRLHQVAADALEQLGPEAAAVLAEGLGHPDAVLRRRCAFVLQWLPPSAAKACKSKLTAALEDKDAQVRLDSAMALWRLDRAGELIAPVLEKLLVSPEQHIRKPAAEHLCVMRPRPKSATKGISSLLKNSDPAIRVKATWALWDLHHEPKEVLPTLLELLTNPKAGDARARAGEQLTLIGPAAKDALPLLIQEVKAKPGPHQLPLHDLFRAIGKDAMPAAIELLQVMDGGAREAVGSVVGALGPETVQPLLKLIDHPEPQVRLGVLWALTMIGPNAPEAVPALIEVAKSDKVDQVRAVAVSTLGNMGANAKLATPFLLEIVSDEKSPLRLQAIESLLQIGPDGKTTLPVLEEAVNKGQPLQRMKAIELRWRLDGDKKKAVVTLAQMVKEKGNRWPALDLLSRRPELLDASEPALAAIYQKTVSAMADALRDNSPVCRRLAATCLGRLGSLAQPALPALMAALSDKELDVRLAAAEAVGRIGGDGRAAAEALIPDLQTTDFGKMTRANKVVRGLGIQGQQVVAVVRAQFKNAYADSRIHAAETLCSIDPAQRDLWIRELLDALSGGPISRVRAAMSLCNVDGPKGRYIDTLVVALTHPQGEVRQLAVLALAEVGPAANAAAPALEFVLEDEGLGMRVVAAWALWKVGAERKGMDALVAHLQNMNSASSRSLAASYLGGIGPPAKEAVPALTTALQDRNAGVRRTARVALVKIDPQAAAAAGIRW
jgi:HEAT repeat protein